MYKVVKDFTDLQDNGHVYLAGDTYPRKGAKPDPKRIDELGSKFNKRGEVLIEAVVAPQEAEISPVEEEKAEADELVAETETKPKKAKSKKE